MVSDYSMKDLRRIELWFKNYYKIMRRRSMKDLREAMRKVPTPRKKSIELHGLLVGISLMEYCVYVYILQRWDEFYHGRLKAPTSEDAHKILESQRLGRFNAKFIEPGLKEFFEISKNKFYQSLDYFFQISRKNEVKTGRCK